MILPVGLCSKDILFLKCLNFATITLNSLSGIKESGPTFVAH